MHEHGQVLVFASTLVIFAVVLVLIRQRKIGEKFAVLWLSISIVLLVASSIGYRYLFKIAALVGVPYPPSALFFLAITGLTLLIIELFVWVSKLNERTKTLGQDLAILREQFEREKSQP